MRVFLFFLAWLCTCIPLNSRKRWWNKWINLCLTQVMIEMPPFSLGKWFHTRAKRTNHRFDPCWKSQVTWKGAAVTCLCPCWPYDRHCQETEAWYRTGPRIKVAGPYSIIEMWLASPSCTGYDTWQKTFRWVSFLILCYYFHYCEIECRYKKRKDLKKWLTIVLIISYIWLR